MGFLEFLLLAAGLSLDAFAVALGSAANGLINDKRSAVRLSFHFGLFQALMPVIGWSIGNYVDSYVRFLDHWIAFILLLIIGVKMIYESLDKENNKQKTNPSKGWSLVLLSVATSIDALVVGFSLALIRIDIWYPSMIIGLTTGAFTLTGIYSGVKLGAKFGKRMEMLGGLIIIAIGLKILLSDLGLL